MYELAIFGGAFDPFHSGHLHVIRQTLEHAKRVMVVPSYAHPYGKQMAPFELRSRWLVDSLDEWLLDHEYPRVTVSAVEKHLASVSDSPVYSCDLLIKAQSTSGLLPHQIALVVGEDIQPYLNTFQAPDILKQFGSLIIEEPPGTVHSRQIRGNLSGKIVMPPSGYVSDKILHDITRYYKEAALND